MLRRYTDLRAWFRSLAKSSVHAGSGAIIAGAGSNAFERMTPEAFASYTAGVGLNFSQMIAVFVAACFWTALRKIHADTAPTGDTNPPITK